jgi:uncharacterized protein (TIGR03067 family)
VGFPFGILELERECVMIRSRNFALIAVGWLVCAAVLLSPHAAPGQERATKKEIVQKLKGGWECVADHMNGKYTERQAPYTSRFFFEAGGVFKARTKEDPTEVTASGIWTIVEVGEKYFKMNIDITEGESKGETFVGIADFDKGQLRWSMRTASKGGGRPDGFESQEGDTLRAYTFQRIK